MRSEPRWLQLFMSCVIAAPGSAAANDAAIASRIDTCETQIRIGGSVYHEKKPARSWALLYPPASKRGGVYRPGMRIDAYRVVAIEPRGILLQGRDELCWLRLAPALDSPPARRPPQPARPKRSRTASAAFTRDELARGVQKIQAQSYVVQRSLVREALARAPRIARSTRTRFVGSRAQPKGMQLRSLARDGLLESLGLRRADVLKTLNGFSLTTPDGILGARGQVQNAQRLSLSIERKGKALTLEYRID